MSTTPATGNDLIQVNGTTVLTGSSTKVTPNFIAGTIPTSGTYTILNSTGGLRALRPDGPWFGRDVVLRRRFLQSAISCNSLPYPLSVERT